MVVLDQLGHQPTALLILVPIWRLRQAVEQVTDQLLVLLQLGQFLLARRITFFDLEPRDGRTTVPGDLHIEPGPHRIEIRADGYETLEFEVRLLPDKTTTYEGELKRLP